MDSASEIHSLDHVDLSVRHGIAGVSSGAGADSRWRTELACGCAVGWREREATNADGAHLRSIFSPFVVSKLTPQPRLRVRVKGVRKGVELRVKTAKRASNLFIGQEGFA